MCMKPRKNLHPRRLSARLDRIFAPLTVIFLLLPFTCLAGGCRMIDTWPGSEVVTPSGVETTTSLSTSTTTSGNQPTTTAAATTTTATTPATTTKETQQPTAKPTETSQTALPPTPTVTQHSWDGLDKLDNSKAGWYYVPATTLGADQPATLPQIGRAHV